jgi:hydrogenase maturation protease
MKRKAESRRTAAKVLVIGVGNRDRGDDGIGPVVAERLEGRVPACIAIIERSGDALALIEDWAGRESVVLVDAAAPGGEPGRVHRVDLLADELPAGLSLSSTHALGVAEAVGLARTLGMLPARIVVYAVEGKKFDPGADLSPEVMAAVEGVVARVAAELRLLGKEAGHA